MFLRRSAIAATRQSAIRSPFIARSFTSSVVRTKHDPAPGEVGVGMKKFEDIKTDDDLLPPGAPVGTIPTDLNQSTGLERLEILGKMQGVDIFDMKPLDASRKGTLEDPIMVSSFGDEQYAGCTGYPVDSHIVNWLVITRDHPVGRCPECGNVLKMEYVGPQDDGHGHGDHHHGYEEPKTMADFIRPEYRDGR
ncbi:COX5B-domain-containing protein [Aulographum hederae CBS 113979]|uniref:Cytochrome c oxidase subunit 4, mitochondrial n=1 Tax=Aulographum hederae CBS 113979 TaxID=1176131 RepID=A0A6G1HBG8_9PEZI|nr:COX5B-domain-containing protein [Aulographum hederae CBS 113979]